MANTTNLDLVKPLGTDHALVAQINSNSEKIDAEAGRTRANFAAEYSASSAYAVGAFCTHNGILYQCNTAIGSGGEAWTSGHWTQISAGDAIVANNQAIATLNSNFTDRIKYNYASYSPTYPSNVTGQGGNPTTYFYSASVVHVALSVKLTNITQTGYSGRVVFPHNLPANIKPPYTVQFVGNNGEADGITTGLLDSTNITIYPGKTGTTYCQVGITYITGVFA
jgi:hypothetical protein